MSAAPLTPARLAAQLVTDFCIPVISGKVSGKPPVEGRPLTPEERGRLGRRGYGATVFYPVGQDAVMLDLGGATSTVLFEKADCVAAAEIMDAALKRAFPAIQQIADEPHAQNPDLRARGYALELGDRKRCTIEMGYPLPHASGDNLIFVLRVNAQVRQ
ncbi:MAG: hypothetical protein GC206_01920 [Alphaproteobacteria bacterium]|nr:hypothetical protein [Alphaproteobacteria bacterium]